MAKIYLDKQENSFSNTSKKLYSSIMILYLLITLGVFPLFYDNYYYNILRAKYAFFYISVVVAFAFFILLTVVLAIKDQKQYNGSNRKRIISGLAPKKIWKNSTLVDKCLLLFLLFVLISTIQSDFLFESFWGNEGRFSGLFLILLYAISVFLVGKFGKIRKWHLEVFLIASALVCMFGITDYFRMDILGFMKNVSQTDRDSFTSTMGNINTYTAYVALAVGVASGLFVTEKNIFRAIFHYLILLIAFFAIITGQSDNAYLALGALFGLLPLILFGKRAGIKRYVLITAGFMTIIKVIAEINVKMSDKVIGLSGIFQLLTEYEHLSYIVIALWLAVIVLYIGDYFIFKGKEDKVGKWLRILWSCFLALGVAVIIYVLYDANFGGNADKYAAISRYVVFNDAWGTNRGYCWRIGWESYMALPLHHKLFGFGPDTFGILTWGYRDEALATYGVYFESAHNEYFQYLVTMGPFTLLAYLAFLGSACAAMVKCLKQTPWVLAPLAAVVCYGAQALVNINLPIATPVMWTLLAVGVAMCRETMEKNNTNMTAADNSVQAKPTI